MTSTITYVPQTPRHRARTAIVAVVLVAAIAGAFLGIDRLVRTPDRVDRIEIRNPTDQLVDVRVRGDDGGAWLPVVIVEPRRSAVTHDVIDQGDIWIFEFRTAGDDPTRVRVTSTALEDAGWQVTVPDRVVAG